jgi:hypothetical protein
MRKLALAAFLATLSCSAGVIVFQGNDAGAGPGSPRPQANAARDAFLAAIAGSSSFLLDFESIPVQYAAVINLTTMTLSQIGTTADADGGVSTGATVGANATLGYNTTPGGEKFLRITPIFDIGTAGARLTFNTPVEFFGVFITGLGTAAGNLTIEFNNGAAFALPVQGTTTGGVNFIGFTTFGAPITYVDMVLRGVTGSRDIFALDDIITGLQPTYVSSGDVPEPTTLSLAGVALAGLAILRRRS